MATVSIVTPTFNHGRFIGPCIESVLGQSVSDWEMWIIDDGSDDATVSVAESYRDPRITVVRRRHAGLDGLGASYATAVGRSSAPLVAVLEGDDAWPPTKLAAQIRQFDDDAVVLAYGPAGLLDDVGCEYARYWSPPGSGAARNDPVGSILPALVRGNFLVSSTVMIRRIALDKIGGFIQPDGVPYVDHPTWLKLATMGTFAVSDSIVGFWRRHSQQFTTASLASERPDMGPFFRRLAEEVEDAELQATLAKLVEATLVQHQSKQARRAAVGQARLALLRGNWKEAAKRWSSLLASGHPPTTAVAVVGLAASAVHSDVEWVFRRRNRISWPSRRHLASHAQIKRVSHE